jgi:hypothetical protein
MIDAMRFIALHREEAEKKAVFAPVGQGIESTGIGGYASTGL